MTNLIKKYLFLDIDTDDIKSVSDDILEENRKGIILYSTIGLIGMSILFILSFFLDVFYTRRIVYEIAIIAGTIFLLIASGPGKKYKGLVVASKFFFIIFLFGLGIVLGTVIEPNQASASFAVLLFVAPFLFSDLPYRINFATVINVIIYIIVAKKTQSKAIFSFNMSVIMPYAFANLIINYFTSKLKIERFIFSKEKKMMAYYDRLTGMLNRWSFEDEVKEVKADSNIENDIAVCSFDVNNLKEVNDRWGHKAGDELLIATGKVIENVIGKYGNCYRIGGDEYMAIIKNTFPSPDELVRMLNKEALTYKTDYDYELFISSGIVVGNHANIDEMIIEADKLMYVHKNEYYLTNKKNRR